MDKKIPLEKLSPNLYAAKVRVLRSAEKTSLFVREYTDKKIVFAVKDSRDEKEAAKIISETLAFQSNRYSVSGLTVTLK